MTPVEKAPLRVLVVEDSRVVAEFLTQLLNSDAAIRVVAVATDGEEALAAALRERPDVITMDIHMPKVNGFEATRQIMEICPTPIVIVSGTANTDEVALNFRAVEAGALAVVARPGGGEGPDRDAARQLLDTVKLMSEVKVVRRWSRMRYAAAREPAVKAPLLKPPRRPQVVAIGASTGGPIVLQTILSGLPKDFALPLLIVQHMTPGFAPGFVEWLGDSAGFAVHVAVDGELILPGHAYIAPDDVHMGVRPGQRIRLSTAAHESGVRPSVSFLLRSVREVYGADAVGILLTGMGRDGADELKRLHERGAVTIAQDEASSVVHGMPGEAIGLGAAGHILAPQAIAKILATMV